MWIVGLGRYGEDYCFTKMNVPSEARIISDPNWKPPLRVECDYGQAGTRTKRDALPLVWTIGALVGASTSVTLIWRSRAAAIRLSPAR